MNRNAFLSRERFFNRRLSILLFVDENLLSPFLNSIKTFRLFLFEFFMFVVRRGFALSKIIPSSASINFYYDGNKHFQFFSVPYFHSFSVRCSLQTHSKHTVSFIKTKTFSSPFTAFVNSAIFSWHYLILIWDLFFLARI